MLESLKDSQYFEFLLAAGIFGLFLLGAGLIYVSFRVVASRVYRLHPDALFVQVLGAIRNSAALFVVFVGAFSVMTTLSGLDPWQGAITQGWTIVAVIIVARAIANLANVSATWYIKTVAPKTKTQFDDRMFPIFRRIFTVVIYGVMVLLVLDTAGLSISPLLGGLGITGLAVALALQPTLSNFFAGSYVISDGAIRTGDYIELKGGPAGYVIDVGWRTTKLRTWLNTLIIVPNAVLADTIITNYQGPSAAMNILINCGVSYDSDLGKVESVSLEVARQVIHDCPDANKGMEPWFSYDRFGDSNIDFWVYLQANDRIGGFVVTSELIKRLHERFAAENIEINYPVRKIVYPGPSGHSPDAPRPG